MALKGDRRQGMVRHKTLSAYYRRLHTLGEYLDQAAGEAVCYRSDPPVFRDFLQNTICAPREHKYGPFPSLCPSHGTQQEAINEVLRELSRHGRPRSEVLLFGNVNSAYLPANISAPRADIRHVENASSILRGKPWCILRTRIGNAAFQHLLTTTSIFLLLGNNCYLQLCGPPVFDMYDHKGNEPTAVPAKRKCREEQGRRRKAAKVAEEDGGLEKVRRRGSATLNLNRQKMFYGRPPRTPRGQIAYGLPLNLAGSGTPTDQSCLELLRTIFPSMMRARPALADENDVLAGVSGSRKRSSKVLDAMRELITRHAQIDYHQLLRLCLDRLREVDLHRYPPLSDPKAEKRAKAAEAILGIGGAKSVNVPTTLLGAPNETGEALPSLQAVSHNQVCRFITSVLRQLLPITIAGSQSNLDVICSRARSFVKAKMYEPISVHSVLQGLRLNDIPWLAACDGIRVPPQEAAKRRELAQKFMAWLFDDYLNPLLRASFYVTETAETKYETVYYAHDAWTTSTEPHLQKLEEQLLERLTPDAEKVALHGQLGVSAVRLIPKPNGFRPIVNLGRKIKVQNTLGVTSTGKTMTTNQLLSNIHHVLTYERTRKAAELGGSLFGTNELFGPLNLLKRELLSLHGMMPKLYFVKMDIKAAFDTIKQDKMLEVVEALLEKDHDYCLMLYCLLLPPASKASRGSARRLFKTRAVVDPNSHMSEHAQAMAKPLRNAVLVDMVRRKHISSAECMSLLRRHIKNNVWQVRNRFFRQKTGIPQGSKISSLLCSFFYACMELEHMKWTRQPGSRMLRYIDDFLFITDDFELARRFVYTMADGFPEYGAKVSPNKTLLSFELAPGGQAAPVAPIQKDGTCYFPYCGFLIDTCSLDISIDSGRLLTVATRQSFALRFNRYRGSNFVGWLSRQLENRNHVAFLDTEHNSEETVHLNVFVNFVLTALKVPLYFAGVDMDERRSKLVYDWLRMAIEYTYGAGRARVRHAAQGDDGEHFAVGRKAFKFLALAAIHHALTSKASRMRHVVARLEQDLSAWNNRGHREKLARVIAEGKELIKNAK